MRMRRIAIIAGCGEPLRLDAPVIEDIVARRHRVLVIAPDLTERRAQAIDELGAERAAMPERAHGPRLFADWKAISAIKSILAEWEPHAVMGCGGKSMVYAALAARAAGVERVVLLIDELPEHRFTGQLADDEMPAWRYGQALRAADEVILNNRDDLALLQRLGLIPSALPAIVVPGAGVDLAAHATVPLPPAGGGIVFLMVADLDTRKGVIEYCQAAERVRANAPSTRFLLAGAPSKGATAIDPGTLGGYGSHVEYLGPVKDVREVIAHSHIFVYPSHREGMPQPVLEAMAAGRPIITTDIAGCRDTVDERINGCLVPPRDAPALARAMESFLKRPDLIAPIARASRTKAERFCGIDAVKGPMLAALGID